MTQPDLADALDRLGRPLTAVQISKIEKTDRELSLDDAAAIADALGVSVDDLIAPGGLDIHVD